MSLYAQLQRREAEGRPIHIGLRAEATGVATCWNADVVATAKRDLAPGERLDGEGGYTVWNKLLRPVKKGQSLSWADAALDRTTNAYRLRAERESMFALAAA